MKLRGCNSGKNLQQRLLVLFALAVVFGLVLGAPQPARADSLNLTFGIPAPLAPPPGEGPWGTLSLVLNPDESITANFMVTPGMAFSTDVLCFNVVGSVAGFNVTGLPGGWSGEAFPYGSATCSGTSFGNMDAYVAGYGYNQTDLTFTMTRDGGFSTVYDLMAPSIDGDPSVDWFAEIYQNGSFGLAGAGQPTPEPSTILLFGSGLLGLAGLLRRKLL